MMSEGLLGSGGAARSGPRMITARSAEEPVPISVTVSMIGCVKLKVAPGIRPVSLS